MKLDIQKFSGGSYDYKYYVFEEYYKGRMYDIELNDLVNDLTKVLHDVEWWQSGDIGEEDYKETVRQFKQKWFNGNRKERLKSYVDSEVEKVKQDLYDLIGE